MKTNALQYMDNLYIQFFKGSYSLSANFPSSKSFAQDKNTIL